jgi:hypothetical protein
MVAKTSSTTCGARPADGDEVLVEDDICDEGSVGADGQVVAMGEVDDALDAENERGANAGQGEDGAGDEAVDQELGELLDHLSTQPRLVSATGTLV